MNSKTGVMSPQGASFCLDQHLFEIVHSVFLSCFLVNGSDLYRKRGCAGKLNITMYYLVFVLLVVIIFTINMSGFKCIGQYTVRSKRV